jgi:hypothetical protein
LLSEIPLYISNSSTDADFNSINFVGSGNFIRVSRPNTTQMRPRLRVN